VYERREASNVFFDWAGDHHEPHFQQVSEAQARYSALLEGLMTQLVISSLRNWSAPVAETDTAANVSIGGAH